MNLDEILAIGQATAKHLGIRTQRPQLILDKIKPLVSVTTILHNENWMLWIDRHYVAYSSMSAPEVFYVMADHEHINEELRSVVKLLRTETSAYHTKTLLSIKAQLRLAQSAMQKSNEQYYLSEMAKVLNPYMPCTPHATLKTPYIMALCGVCRSQHENVYKLRRVDLEQYKERCTFCNEREGYDYELSPKQRKERI